MEHSRTTHNISRRVLGAAAWTMLVLVVLGTVEYLPAIEARISGPDAIPAWQVLGKGIALVGLLTWPCLWVSALWHAVTDVRERVLPKPVLIIMIAVGNFVAAFFYYFLYVLWRPNAGSSTEVNN